MRTTLFPLVLMVVTAGAAVAQMQPSPATGQSRAKALATQPAGVNEDARLIRDAADQYEANQRALIRWEGTAVVISSTPAGDGKPRLEKQTVRFVDDQRRQAVQWLTSVDGDIEVEDPDGTVHHARQMRLGGIRRNDAFIELDAYEPGDSNSVVHRFGIRPPQDGLPRANSYNFHPAYLQQRVEENLPRRLRFLADRIAESEGRLRVRREGDLVYVESVTPQAMNRYVLDLSKAAVLVGYEAKDQTTQEEYKFEYQKVAGVWIPQKSSFRNKGANGRLVTASVEFSESIVNEAAGKDEFTIGSLGIKSGDEIVDQRLKRQYTYKPEVENLASLKEWFRQPQANNTPQTLPIPASSGQKLQRD